MTTGTPTLVGTILFTDLVGFTEYTDACGDADAVRVLDTQRDVIDAVIAVFGSRVVKELGDGLMVWSPTADDGVRCAVGFLRGIDDRRDGGSFPLSVRVGLHHGPVTERGDDLVGQTVNVAARIVDLAGPSEILVSDDVVAGGEVARSLCPEPVGPVLVKGVASPVWLHRLA